MTWRGNTQISSIYLDVAKQKYDKIATRTVPDHDDIGWIDFKCPHEIEIAREDILRRGRVSIPALVARQTISNVENMVCM